MTIEELKEYIKDKIFDINRQYPNTISNEQIERFIESNVSDNMTQTEIDSKKIEIDAIYDDYIARIQQRLEYLKEMKNKFNDNEYQTKNIEELDVSTLDYSQMENLFFHYSWKKFLESYDKDGMKPVIGENSDGIDPEPSIFFSKGAEGVLELWDVWLKWRLNRQNNPQYRGNTLDEIKATLERYKTNNISDEERKEWYYWMEYLKEKKYLSNNEMLTKLFEYQYNEMINSDYLIMDLKENEEFRYDQIDIKKQKAIDNSLKTGKGIDSLTLAQYGAYSDLSTAIVDKWNMQTIPGKDMTIEPSRLKRLTINGNTDVYSIMKFMYDKYKKEVSVDKQVKFDVLDKYIEYVEEKKKNNIEQKASEIHDIYYQYPGEDRSKDIKGKVYIMPPNPEKGFNCGYSLFVPDECQPDTTLLVHSCNTGGAGVTDGKLDRTKTAIHLSEGNEAAKLSTIKMNPGMWFGSDLKMPVLTPLIPRVQGYYTQALGSKVFENDVSTLIADNNDRPIEKQLSEQEIKQIQEQCRDLPSQLVSIISESKGTLEQLGVKVDSKVIMEGYSAGSKFANCFTALHPEMVKACISGGTSGLGILPISQLNGETLNFPLGVANVPNFNAEAFKSIPQYYYIGNQDYNDPAMVSDKQNETQTKLQPRYKENYTPHEITQIQTQLGKNPQERFDNNQRMYAQLGVNAKFQKFNGDHNSVTQQRDVNGNFITNESVKGFIREVISKEKTIQQAQQTKSSEPVRTHANDTPKKSESFSRRSQSEIQIHQQIKEKNQVIKQQKAQKQQLNKPKVKTLSAPSSQGNGSSGNKGYTNIILLSLIVSFVCGALFMVVYMIIGR